MWSAEDLTADRVRKAASLRRPQSNAFHSEGNLSTSDRSDIADYRASGYDRGHMSPNADMSSSEAQQESFSLANIVPQDPCNNEVLWEGIESAVRALALAQDEVFVVTGPAFRGETLQSLHERVIVPTHLFKAVYIPARNAAGAYWAPNDASQHWETKTIAELNTLTGMDIFPGLDANVKSALFSLPAPTPRFGCRTHYNPDRPDGRFVTHKRFQLRWWVRQLENALLSYALREFHWSPRQ